MGSEVLAPSKLPIIHYLNGFEIDGHWRSILQYKDGAKVASTTSPLVGTSTIQFELSLKGWWSWLRKVDARRYG